MFLRTKSPGTLLGGWLTAEVTSSKRLFGVLASANALACDGMLPWARALACVSLCLVSQRIGAWPMLAFVITNSAFVWLPVLVHKPGF